MDVRLNFINLSFSAIAPQVLLYQKGNVEDENNPLVVWKSINRCGFGCNHPFVYPTTSQVGITDAYGNETPKLSARSGMAFAVSNEHSGHRLAYEEPCGVREIQVRNQLKRGAIDASIFKNGSPLVTCSAVAPGQKASFQIHPILYISATQTPLKEARFMEQELPAQPTRLVLVGLERADIILTGGGAGPEATAFTFTLDNVVLA